MFCSIIPTEVIGGWSYRVHGGYRLIKGVCRPRHLGHSRPPTNKTCVILSTVVAWCLLFVTAERYGLPFVIPTSLIMGKGNDTEHTTLLRKWAHSSLRPQLFQPSVISVGGGGFLCVSSNWPLPLSGRISCSEQLRFRASKLGRMQITTTKAQFQRRRPGTGLAPPPRERRNP